MSLSPENDDIGSSSEFNQHLALFREIPLFAGMPIQAHKVLAYLCTRETFEPGELLFQQGDDDGQAIYILSGTLVLSHSGDQNQKTNIAEFADGDFLGGLSLLGPSPRLFSLEAKSRVVCMVLTREKFQHAMEQFSEVMPKAIQAVVERIHNWDKHVLNNPVQIKEGLMAQAGVSMI